jgi:hypothetical protein
VATATALASSANPSAFGAPVTFTAQVSSAGGTPTGSVQFFDGTTLLATRPLDATGSAAYTSSALSAGTHAITAAYAGTTGFLTSTSSAVSQRVVVPARVQAVTIDDGSTQRSMVRSLSVTFDGLVTFAGSPTAAFALTRVGGGSVGFTATAATVGGVTVVTLTGFTGAETANGSLNDGRYTLTALAGQITAGGLALDGNGDGTPGDDYVMTDNGQAGGLYRLFGDANGDRRVDNADFFLLKQTFLRSTGDPLFLSGLDYDGSGTVDNADLFQFKQHFGTAI